MCFFNIFWERKQLGGACFVRVPANVPCVFMMRVSKYWRSSSLCISLCGLSPKSSIAFLLTELLISVGLSRLHCLHHGCASHPPPPKKKILCTLIAFIVAFTFWVSTTQSFLFFPPFFLSFLFFSFAKGTWGSPEWQGDLLKKWPRDATNTLTLQSLVHNCYTWKVTAGRQ